MRLSATSFVDAGHALRAREVDACHAARRELEAELVAADHTGAGRRLDVRLEVRLFEIDLDRLSARLPGGHHLSPTTPG
jgi:hypothetical protein